MQLYCGNILQLTNPRNADSECYSEKGNNKRFIFLSQGHREQKGPALSFEGTIWPFALPYRLQIPFPETGLKYVSQRTI